MSEFITCPYCSGINNIDLFEHSDCIDVEESFLHECTHCGKVMKINPQLIIKLKVEECPCQGENHVWELSHTFPKCFSKMVCKYCGEERPLTEEEKVEFNVGTKEEYFESLKRK